MAKYIKGIDVALWEPNIDWAKVRAQGIRFAFIKASQADFGDPLFDSHWVGAKQAGILRGAYHFLDPKVDARIQAVTFLRKVKLEPGDLPPVLDLEELIVNTPGNSKKGLKGSRHSKGKKGSKDGKPDKAQNLIPNSQIISSAEVWLSRVKAETGRAPIIYSAPFFLQDRVCGADGKPPQWAGNHILWIANYLNHELQDNDLPLQPKGWPNWTFWQHSDRGRLDGVMNKEGTQLTGVDLNFYRGTLEELYALADSAMPEGSLDDLPINVEPEKVRAASDFTPMDLPEITAMTSLQYVIKAGDTLSGLALRFHTTVEAIVSHNPQITNPNIIRDGEILNIPQAILEP